MDLSWFNSTPPQSVEEAEFHRFRSQGIGSSDIASIMGSNPFKSIYELWAEKCGLLKAFEGNEATRRGQRLEPIARELYEQRVGAKFPPTRFVHGEYEFIRANLDGANSELNKLIEIKAPNQKTIDMAKNGEVPSYYESQIQWQLMTSGIALADYVVLGEVAGGYEITVVQVSPDIKIHTKMIKAAISFWKSVEEFRGKQ